MKYDVPYLKELTNRSFNCGGMEVQKLYKNQKSKNKQQQQQQQQQQNNESKATNVSRIDC